MDVGMMNQDEEEFAKDYQRDSHNEKVYSLIDSVAKSAMKFGILNQEKYNAALNFFNEQKKNGEFVSTAGSPVEEFVNDVKAKLCNMAGKKM